MNLEVLISFEKYLLRSICHEFAKHTTRMVIHIAVPQFVCRLIQPPLVRTVHLHIFFRRVFTMIIFFFNGKRGFSAARVENDAFVARNKANFHFLSYVCRPVENRIKSFFECII